MGLHCSKHEVPSLGSSDVCADLFEVSTPEEIIEKLINQNPNWIMGYCSLAGVKGTFSYYSSLGNPLHAAAIHGRLSVAKLLIEHGAVVDSSYEDGDTPLILACSEGHLDFAKLLLEHGADINKRGKWQSTSLSRASYHGCEKLVAYLVERGAEVDVLDAGIKGQGQERGDSPLIMACIANHPNIAKKLIEYGASVDMKGSGGMTALMRVCRQNNVDLARMLIELGASIEEIDDYGFNALKYANKHSMKFEQELKEHFEQFMNPGFK